MTSFVDTSVLVYVYDHGSREKREIARRLIADEAGELVVSAQVLSEFYWVVTKKLDPALPLDAAREVVGHLATFPVVPIDRPLVLRAVETAHRGQLGLCDAQIVEAAVAAGCETIITEGLNAGQAIRGVDIVNPFEDVT